MTNRGILTIAYTLAVAVPAIAQVSPPAVLTPTDPDLRLWLRADTLVDGGLVNGDPVGQWVDQSQYGTILAPRTDSNPNGPLGGFPVEENPHLQFTDINGNTVPTVRFDRDGDIFQTGDPNVDGSGSTDRLYQTNNLTPNFDPLDIGDAVSGTGTSLTAFAVFLPEFTTTPALGVQSVFAKRGSNASVYSLQIENRTGNPALGGFMTVNYDSPTVYFTPPRAENTWHVTSLRITDVPDSGQDMLEILDDESEDPTQKMVNLTLNQSSFTDRNDQGTVPEPFAIGGHSQNCCGEGETFSGNIAEIIIFARTLTAQESSDVEDYLDAKYFAAASMGVPGDYNDNGTVDAADYVLWRRNFGQFFGLENENPAAATEGFVDQEDYEFWMSRFGATAGSGAVFAENVPEPTALLLVASAVMTVATCWRRKI